MAQRGPQRSSISNHRAMNWDTFYLIIQVSDKYIELYQPQGTLTVLAN